MTVRGVGGATGVALAEGVKGAADGLNSFTLLAIPANGLLVDSFV